MTTFDQGTRHAFAKMVAAWQLEPLCDVVHDECADGLGHVGTGQRCCTEPATWRWRRHDCTAGILCSFHVELWHAAVARAQFPAACEVCGKTFQSLDDMCTVTPL